MAAGLDGEGEQFGEGDAGEDEESAGGAAAAETFAIEEERGEPGEDRLEGEDERGVRGAPDWLAEVLSPSTASHDRTARFSSFYRFSRHLRNSERLAAIPLGELI